MTDDSKDYAAGLNERLGGYDSAMGLRFTRATLTEIVAEMPITPQHHQPYGLVHGGVKQHRPVLVRQAPRRR